MGQLSKTQVCDFWLFVLLLYTVAKNLPLLVPFIIKNRVSYMAAVVEFQTLIKPWCWQKRRGHHAWFITGPSSEFLRFWEAH